MTVITYEDRSEYTTTPTFRTHKYGNLLSDTFQGEVYQSGNGTWAGWFTNLSDANSYCNPTDYRLGFATKAAATRWVNSKLREVMR